jgi:hypothetical protein
MDHSCCKLTSGVILASCAGHVPLLPGCNGCARHSDTACGLEHMARSGQHKVHDGQPEVRHLWMLTTGAALANTGAAFTLMEAAAGADTAEQAGAKTLRSWAVLLPSAFC